MTPLSEHTSAFGEPLHPFGSEGVATCSNLEDLAEPHPYPCRPRISEGDEVDQLIEAGEVRGFLVCNRARWV